MAGSQIATSVTIISSGLKGYQGISLTNFTTSALSAIAAGSTVEIANAFFIFSTEESVTGFTVITTATTAYLALTPSGVAGSQTVDAAWTSTAPVWSTSKQGYYASAASVTRIVAMGAKTGTTAFEYAELMPLTQKSRFQKQVAIGPWNMDTTAGTVLVSHYCDVTKIRAVSGVIFNDAENTTYPIPYPPDGQSVYITQIAASQLVLSRALGSAFDSVNFDSTTINRGFLTIDYEI